MPGVSGVSPRGVRDVSYQTFLQILPLKGSQHRQGYLHSLSAHPKRPSAWEEEEEEGEQGDMTEEDKAMRQRICGKLMGIELAVCPSKFSFPWLCAGSFP